MNNMNCMNNLNCMNNMNNLNCMNNMNPMMMNQMMMNQMMMNQMNNMNPMDNMNPMMMNQINNMNPMMMNQLNNMNPMMMNQMNNMNPMMMNQMNNMNPMMMNQMNQMNNMNPMNNMNQMNQMNNMNPMNNMNIMQDNNEQINILFKSSNQPTITIQGKYNEKMSSIIMKYINLICDSSDNKEYYFGSKKVSKELTVSEQGLKDNCEINVKEVDIKDSLLVKKKKEGIFNDLKEGINILGECSYKDCEFQNKEVISYFDGNKFELISNLYNVTCPHCSCIIIPKKIVFYKCNFIISGKKLDKEFVIPFTLDRKDINENDYYYIFDPDKDENTTYIEILSQIFIKYN